MDVWRTEAVITRVIDRVLSTAFPPGQPWKCRRCREVGETRDVETCCRCGWVFCWDCLSDEAVSYQGMTRFMCRPCAKVAA